MPNSRKRKRLSAFSIAEVVLSGFLLTTGIISVVSLYSVSHRSSFDTRNMITAAELAQEGVEVVRNIRDNNTAYRVANWTTGDNCSTSTSGNCDPFRYFPNGASSRCTASYNSTGAAGLTCPLTQPQIAQNAGGFLYNGAGSATRFYRIIKINHVSPSDTALVQSFATWQNPGSNLNGGGAITWCTPYNQCVYTELLLSRWK